MIYILLIVLHVLICFFLVIVVLLQSGKAADLAGAFGGMGSQTAFGPRGSATLLSKATTAAAALFMITSLTLAIMATSGVGGPGTTVLEEHPAAPAQSQPAPAQSRPVPRAPQANVPVTAPAGARTVTIPISPNAGPGQQAPAAPAKQAPAAPAKK
jgi:preprotein translocase subunit SecG